MKLTPEVHAAIVEAISLGTTLQTASQCAGINPRTLRRWLKTGKDGQDPACASLFADVQKAKADAMKHAITVIRAAGEKNWTAYAWWLERQYPELYSKDSLRVRELERLLADLVKSMKR